MEGHFDYRDAGDLANAPETDIWDSPGSVSYTHAYSLGGLTPLSATLDVQIAGIHDINDATAYEVRADGVLLGEIPANASANAFQEVKLYSFAVPTGLLDGSTDIVIGEGGVTSGDGYSVNFSELKITANGDGRVPDGGTTLIMLGVSMLALGRLRRRLV